MKITKAHNLGTQLKQSVSVPLCSDSGSSRRSGMLRSEQDLPWGLGSVGLLHLSLNYTVVGAACGYEEERSEFQGQIWRLPPAAPVCHCLVYAHEACPAPMPALSQMTKQPGTVLDSCRHSLCF